MGLQRMVETFSALRAAFRIVRALDRDARVRLVAVAAVDRRIIARPGYVG